MQTNGPLMDPILALRLGTDSCFLLGLAAILYMLVDVPPFATFHLFVVAYTPSCYPVVLPYLQPSWKMIGFNKMLASAYTHNVLVWIYVLTATLYVYMYVHIIIYIYVLLYFFSCEIKNFAFHDNSARKIFLCVFVHSWLLFQFKNLIFFTVTRYYGF